MMAVRGEHRRGMMGGGCVDHALHERAAVARLAIPSIREQIAVCEGTRQVVRVEHGEPVPHAVHALEQYPATRARTLERLTQSFDLGLRHLLARFEIRLDHAVATTRREAVATGGESGGANPAKTAPAPRRDPAGA